jgi:hypothetical protein
VVSPTWVLAANLPSSGSPTRRSRPTARMPPGRPARQVVGTRTYR